jgi:hypothetical protein
MAALRAAVQKDISDSMGKNTVEDGKVLLDCGDDCTRLFEMSVDQLRTYFDSIGVSRFEGGGIILTSLSYHTCVFHCLNR